MYGPLGCDNMKKLSHVFGVISSNLNVFVCVFMRTEENEKSDVQSNRHLTWRRIPSDLYRQHDPTSDRCILTPYVGDVFLIPKLSSVSDDHVVRLWLYVSVHNTLRMSV